MLRIFPKFYTDLYAADMLQTFVYKHLLIKESDKKLRKEIIKCMCIDAAEGIKLQCGRENGFSKSDARSTQIDKIAPNELSGLLTNNLDTERDLSKISRLYEVEKF